MQKIACTCGELDVTMTDHAFRLGDLLVVHGKDFCYTMPCEPRKRP